MKTKQKIGKSKIGKDDPLSSKPIPSSSYNPSHPNFELPSGIEHPPVPALVDYRIRYAFATSKTLQQGFKASKHIIRDHWEWEMNHILNVSDSIKTHIEQASPYLRNLLFDAFAEAMYDTELIIAERKEWYHHKLPRALKTATKNASDIDPDKHFRSALVLSESGFEKHSNGDSTGVIHKSNVETGESDLIISEKHFNPRYKPSKHEFELPQRFLVCESTSSHRYYIFLPWCGTLQCSCPYNRNNLICKHMVSALTHLVSPSPDHSTFKMSGPCEEVHPRFSRFHLSLPNNDYGSRFTQPIEKTHPASFE